MTRFPSRALALLSRAKHLSVKGVSLTIDALSNEFSGAGSTPTTRKPVSSSRYNVPMNKNGGVLMLVNESQAHATESARLPRSRPISFFIKVNDDIFEYGVLISSIRR